MSAKSESLFSNYTSGMPNSKKQNPAYGEYALTEYESGFDGQAHSSNLSEASMNTKQNCDALEQQLQKYEADIRKHISIEHQLQLFTEDLKRSISTLEKEKELLETANSTQIEELKKDKLTLREFLDIKERTIEEKDKKINELTQQAAEFKVQLTQHKQKYEK